MSDSPSKSPNWKFILLYLVGGGCLGSGLLFLYWSFGWESGPLNSDFAAIGFSGLDNIAFLDSSNFSIGLVICGLLCLVVANMDAWKETDGY